MLLHYMHERFCVHLLQVVLNFVPCIKEALQRALQHDDICQDESILLIATVSKD